VHWSADRRFHVFHMPEGDPGTTCALLRDCLQAVRTWSDDHPLHQPIFVLIDPADELDPLKLDGHYQALDAEIRAVFAPRLLITPDDVRGHLPTLAQAVARRGWPTLGDARGRVMFVLADAASHRAAYSRGGTSLAGRVMFVDAAPGSRLGGVRVVADPVGREAEIRGMVATGWLVLTAADHDGVEAREGDTTRLQAALHSGAQVITTDFPTPAPSGYVVTIPTGTPSRCDPVTAPSGCTPSDIENPANLTR
jgi:hypothetical protein